jgi:transcriptional regulator with XRE-family HTH domain
MNTPNEMLKEWRTKKHMSQAQAAKLIAVAQPVWANWEKGRRTPGLRHAVFLQRLGVCPVEAWVPESLELWSEGRL